MALHLKTSQPQVDQTALNRIFVTAPAPDFDRDVAQPIRAKQGELATIRARQEAEAAAKAAEEARVAAENARLARVQAVRDRMKPYGTYANTYTWGNCTAYVASRINVPGYMGNANNWASALSAAGWSVSDTPLPGAIAQTRAGSMGHVAVVEAVNPDGSVLVSEMNWSGLGVIDTRLTGPGEWSYIY